MKFQQISMHPSCRKGDPEKPGAMKVPKTFGQIARASR
jgi:hypothetical protein